MPNRNALRPTTVNPVDSGTTVQNTPGLLQRIARCAFFIQTVGFEPRAWKLRDPARAHRALFQQESPVVTFQADAQWS